MYAVVHGFRNLKASVVDTYIFRKHQDSQGPSLVGHTCTFHAGSEVFKEGLAEHSYVAT